jgi:hypothetical protein
MATMALPIRELEHSVRAAQAETERVSRQSGATNADFAAACKVASTTIALKWCFSGVVRMQTKFISSLVERDFTAVSREEMHALAVSLDGLVARERAILEKTNKLGAEIRVWWNTSLLKLAEQAEHLDSIAESLHVACDDEASALMAFAVEEFAATPVEQLV